MSKFPISFGMGSQSSAPLHFNRRNYGEKKCDYRGGPMQQICTKSAIGTVHGVSGRVHPICEYHVRYNMRGRVSFVTMELLIAALKKEKHGD